MKRGICIFILCLGLLSVFLTSEAAAIGLGLYTSYGEGSASWDIDWESTFRNSRQISGSGSIESETEHSGIGFVMDTNVAKDRLFNYRLKLGYEQYIDIPEGGGRRDEFEGFIMSHAFGFGVLRTRLLRLWLGPQLEFFGYSGNPENNDDFDMFLIGMGIGPVIGLNINLGKVVTLAIDGGYNFRYYGGHGEQENSSVGYEEEYEEDYEIREHGGYVGFALIFRIGDRFDL